MAQARSLLALGGSQRIRGHDTDCLFVDHVSESRHAWHPAFVYSRRPETVLGLNEIAQADETLRRFLARDPIDEAICALDSLPRQRTRDWAAWLNQRFGLGPHIKIAPCA